MNITDVTSYIASIPRQRSLNTYYGDIPDTKTITVLVQTDEGITGIGQTLSHSPHYGDTAESIKANIDNYIKPAILGKNPFDIEYIFELMYKSIGKSTRYPVTAIEFALWDIKGKALNVPVYNLLGGKCNEGAPLHGLADRLSIDESIERIEKLYSEGWTWLKSKIGFDVHTDLTWYQTVYEAVGDKVRFQLDGNTGYTLGEAIHVLTKMEQIGGIALFEQPVLYLDEMAILTERLDTPLQADESVTNPRSVHKISQSHAAHVLHFKIEKFGGLLQAKRMAAIGEAAGLELSVAPYFDIMAAAAAHFAVSTPNVKWPAGFSDMGDTLLSDPYLPVGQVLTPPDKPGLGVNIDEDKMRFYASKWN